MGFGVIYVLTEDPKTWRVQGLLQAVNLTGLQIQVPVQKHLSDDDIRQQLEIDLPEKNGAIRAFLNHLTILEAFAKSDFETALILEDDVDFGIDIRAQMDQVSHAFWNHSKEAWTADSAAMHPYRESEWDIFWPGHYGMSFVDGTDIFKYRDPYALPWSRLTATFNNYYEQMAIESQSGERQPQQLIFNVAPLSTFAYATTKAHAARLVQKISKDGIFRKDGSPFDMALHIDCVGKAHRCVAPVPQLFHHHQVDGERAISSSGGDELQDMTWYESKHKYTFNIEWSARCNAAHVGENVSDRWQCLPNKDDSMTGKP